MKRTKAINNILKRIKSKREPFKLYGTIFKVSYGYIWLFLCNITFGTNWTILVFHKWFKKALALECFRLDITKIMECMRK